MMIEVTFALLAWTLYGVASHLGRRYSTQANILPLAIAGLGLGGKLLGSIFGHKKEKQQRQENEKFTEAQRFAQQRQAEIGNQQHEDTRLGRLSLAQALLGGLPAQTAGGRVNTNATIDPAVLQSLGARRTYDYSKAFAPGQAKQVGGSFIGGLLGGAGNAALDYGLSKIGDQGTGEAGGEMAGPPASQLNTGGGGGNALSPEDILKAYGRG